MNNIIILKLIISIYQNDTYLFLDNEFLFLGKKRQKGKNQIIMNNNFINFKSNKWHKTIIDNKKENNILDLDSSNIVKAFNYSSKSIDNGINIKNDTNINDYLHEQNESQLVDTNINNNYTKMNSQKKVNNCNNFSGFKSTKNDSLKNSNKIKKHKKSSKYRGVTKTKGKWQVYLTFNNINTYIGRYDSEETAAKIYDVFSIKKNGNKAKTNFEYNIKDINKISKADIDIDSKDLLDFVFGI